MARTTSGDVVEVPASNNIYTVLAGIAFLVTLITLIVMFLHAGEVFPGGLMGK